MASVYYLKKLLPELSLPIPQSQRLLASSLDNEDQIRQALSSYFQLKNYGQPGFLLKSEAKSIHMLFPSLSFKYIIRCLQHFSDMPQCKEIVLRIIVYSLNEPSIKNTSKRVNPDYNLTDLSNQPLPKARKSSKTCTITSEQQALPVPNLLEENPIDLMINPTSNGEVSTSLDKIETTLLMTGKNYNKNEADRKNALDLMKDLWNLEPNFFDTTIDDETKTVDDFQYPISLDCVSSTDNKKEEEEATPMNLCIMPLIETNEANSDVQLIEEKQEDLGLDETVVFPVVNLTTEESNVPESYVDLVSPPLQNPSEDSNSNQEINIVKDLFFQDSQQKETKSLGTTKANIIDYMCELTNVDSEKIKKCCHRLKIPINCPPNTVFANLIMDYLSNDIGDGISESEVSSDDNPVSNNQTDNAVPTSSEEKSQSTSNIEEIKMDMSLVNSLCSIFPDACPNYIKKLCENKVMNQEVVDDLITIILNADGQYPKRPQPAFEPEVVPENQLEILKELLPDADPDYLSMMCDKFEGKPEKVKQFINEAMEGRNYPTMKEYLRRQQLSAQQKQYTSEFNVENFIKLIPDPHAFFSDSSRNIKLSASDSHYALVFLRNKFNKLPIRTIQATFNKTQGNISKCINLLKIAMTQSSCVMKSVRRPIPMPNNVENIPLLQEIAYHSHEKEIIEYLEKQKQQEENELKEAKEKGLLETCSCCFDDEVLVKNIYNCENGCKFCKCCIQKSSEVRFGEGKLDFPCLNNCDSAFSLQTLQAVLSPKLFSKVAQKKALEEVKAAGIDELEMCPFCDFATIPAIGYNIFTCMNPECMKESCRMCKEPSHIPLRCDEIEKDEDVRARTFVENKMTEALLRKCYKCGIKFFKEEGCNKMTCSCGAQMCYLCGQPVTGYTHFNGNGGDRYDLCPLYSDTNALNKENVLKGAAAAKAEIGNVNLKHDPTVDIDNHYKQRSRMFPQAHLLVGQIAPPPRPPVPHLLQQQLLDLRRAQNPR